MELILWRHAEAEDGNNDLKRSLTAKGRKQAQISAHWLKDNLPKNTHVWVSQALRSQQTANYFSKKQEVLPNLNPTAYAQEIAKMIAKQPDNGTILCIGHQPWLGQLCAWLLNGNWLPQHYLSVKKAGFWWFEVYFDAKKCPHSKLKAMLYPDVIQFK